MNDSTARDLGKQNNRRFWPDVLIIALLVAFVGIPSLFTRDLWNPDEPRYLEVAREMVVLGDYVIPHLNGEVYSEKPPMFFWLAGQLWRLGFGYNSGRILTIVATLLTLLLTYFTVATRLGRRGALLASGAALSTLLLFDFAKIGVLDPVLMLFTTAALVLGYCALRKEARHPSLCWLGCYAFMGFGTLTKGPVGILVPGLILLAYGLINRRNVRSGGIAHLVGALAFGAVVLAWLAPAMVTGGEQYARTILIKQNLGRAVQAHDHRNPIHYYLLRAPIYFFPWSLVLPLAVAAAVQKFKRDEEDLPLFAALWFIVPIVFFSLMSGKRMNYLVPIAPAVGILSASYFLSQPQSKRTQTAERWLVRTAFVLLGLLATGLIVLVAASAKIMNHLPALDVQPEAILPFLSPLRMAGAAVLFALPLGLCLAVLLGAARSRMQIACALTGALLLLSPPLDLIIMPAVNTLKSGRTFAAEVRERAVGPARVYLYKNDFSGVYNLYTGFVSMPEPKTESELKELLEEPDALVIADGEQIGKALTPKELKPHLLYEEGVGHRRMVLLRGVRPSKSRDSDELPESLPQVSSLN